MTNEWEERYRRGETRWERGELHPAFRMWRDAGAFAGLRNVLVPLAGRSPEPLAFAELGVRPTIVDLAPTAIHYQQDRFAQHGGNGAFHEGDLFAFSPATAFDAIYDQTAMCALPPERWQEYEDRLHDWLRPGGILFALLMQTGREGGPPHHQDWDAVRTIFTDRRWEWPDAPEGRFPHSGDYEEWAVRLRRRPDE